jgi:hypothetical protein
MRKCTNSKCGRVDYENDLVCPECTCGRITNFGSSPIVIIL